MKAIGHKKWCIPDLYLKKTTLEGVDSHESITIVNAGETTAKVQVTFLVPNRKKEYVKYKIEANKVMQIRTDLLDPEEAYIPKEQSYAAIIESDENVVVEYARLNWIGDKMQSFGLIPYYEERE